jgi:hypothetical protein
METSIIISLSGNASPSDNINQNMLKSKYKEMVGDRGVLSSSVAFYLLVGGRSTGKEFGAVNTVSTQIFIHV